MKKVAFLLFLLIISVVFIPYSFMVYAEEIPTHKVIHENTSLYKEADLNAEILFSLSQGTELFLIENSEVSVSGTVFVKVKYGGYTGYVLKDGIYIIYPPLSYNVSHAKIRSLGFGKTCSVYLAPDKNSEVSYEIKDSTKVEKFLITNNGYAFIGYDGKSGYIEAQYVIDKGLTQNETVALIIGCVGFVFLLAVLILIGYSKNLSKKKR